MFEISCDLPQAAFEKCRQGEDRQTARYLGIKHPAHSCLPRKATSATSDIVERPGAAHGLQVLCGHLEHKRLICWSLHLCTYLQSCSFAWNVPCHCAQPGKGQRGYGQSVTAFVKECQRKTVVTVTSGHVRSGSLQAIRITWLFLKFAHLTYPAWFRWINGFEMSSFFEFLFFLRFIMHQSLVFSLCDTSIFEPLKAYRPWEDTNRWK